MHRLKTRPQFQAVLAGKVLAKSAHFALHCCVLDFDSDPLEAGASMALFPQCDVWMGAMVPKRWAKRATTRNTIKRQIYAVGYALESTMLERAHLVRLRSTFDRGYFVSATSDALRAAVRAELHQLFSCTRFPFDARTSTPVRDGIAQ